MSGLDGIELVHQRMRSGDFVVAISADQYEVLRWRADQQVFQQVERRRVEPLQIIEEERQRMFRLGENANEAMQYELKPALRVLWRQFGNRRRSSDDELHFGHQIHDESRVRSQRFPKRVAPGRQLCFALPE